MRKTILVGALIFAAWHYYNKYVDAGGSLSHILPGAHEESGPSPFAGAQPLFQCDGREYCSQMTSYEEAKFFIENCPNTKMDGDRDGIPCERQFGR